VRRTLLFPLVIVALPAFALACGGDDDDDTSPTVEASASTGASPSSAGSSNASPAGTPDNTRAQTLARSATYFMYFAGQGESVDSIADTFGMEAAAMATENGLANGPVAEGQAVALKNINPTSGAVSEAIFIAYMAMPAAKLEVLQPSESLVDGYLGRITLHSARMADSQPAAEGYGYVLEFWLTDRAALKGGDIDGQARQSSRAFTVAAGSLAASLGSGAHTFTRNGVSYAVTVAAEARQSGATIAAGLEPAP